MVAGRRRRLASAIGYASNLDGSAAAGGFFLVLHDCSLMLSMYQPSTPVQPSMPKSNRSLKLSPGATPILVRLIWDTPQLPWTSPPSVPVKPGWPASGLVFPAATVWRVALYGLNWNAEAGIRVKAPPLTLILMLPPSQPVSVA